MQLTHAVNQNSICKFVIKNKDLRNSRERQKTVKNH